MYIFILNFFDIFRLTFTFVIKLVYMNLPIVLSWALTNYMAKKTKNVEK